MWYLRYDLILPYNLTFVCGDFDLIQWRLVHAEKSLPPSLWISLNLLGVDVSESYYRIKCQGTLGHHPCSKDCTTWRSSEASWLKQNILATCACLITCHPITPSFCFLLLFFFFLFSSPCHLINLTLIVWCDTKDLQSSIISLFLKEFFQCHL